MDDGTITLQPRRRAAQPTRIERLCVVHGADAGRVLPMRRGHDLTLGRVADTGVCGLAARGISRRHCAVSWSSVGATWRVRDLDSKNGTFVDGVRIDSAALAPGQVIRVGQALLVFDAHEPLPGGGPDEPTGERSLALAGAMALVDRAATSPVPVLVRGPTGAGKQRIAERLHDASGRSGPLISLNCATLTRDLFASELFGHVRGAFSGARESRDGLFVRADGGTLFLDEIAELPLEQQPGLLRVLQEGRVRPVGSDRERAIDVRVVTATHADLGEMQRDGRFRPDLYARLAGLVVDVPGLAARRVEVLPLLRAFLGAELPPLTIEAAERLLIHDWPLNVRGVQHVAAHIKLFAASLDAIDIPSLPPALRVVVAQTASAPLDEARLIALLTRHRGNISRVARDADTPRPTLYRLLRDFGIDPKTYRET